MLVVEMRRAEILNDLDSPGVILLDPDFGILNSNDGFSEVAFADELPVNGTYTILATRRDGRAGDSVGEYTLRAVKPMVLVSGETITDAAMSNASSYYVVRSAVDFTIIYERAAGNFSPALRINQIGNGELTRIAELEGDFAKGSITIDRTLFSSDLFLVSVTEALFDYNREPVTVEYAITLDSTVE